MERIRDRRRRQRRSEGKSPVTPRRALLVPTATPAIAPSRRRGPPRRAIVPIGSTVRIVVAAATTTASGRRSSVRVRFAVAVPAAAATGRGVRFLDRRTTRGMAGWGAVATVAAAAVVVVTGWRGAAAVVIAVFAVAATWWGRATAIFVVAAGWWVAPATVGWGRAGAEALVTLLRDVILDLLCVRRTQASDGVQESVHLPRSGRCCLCILVRLAFPRQA